MATSAVEQLRLDLGAVIPEQTEGHQPEVDIVASVLDFYQDGYRKAIEELLLDADLLRDQLYTASGLISHGMGRGWRPRYERV
ncbi:hypothetical protein [Rhizobium sp. TRM95796]|uniref:hypothetical protein n=1 Tax=Rhizobium sp. TRM95796 TaxID=2979862 RepID=UPI0021E81A44|nr:hypothetical protein [Rhizobium sp. TRM95796]MCV3767148.1 hypothetical protein [Rhizobium sp. TRM95796]